MVVFVFFLNVVFAASTIFGMDVDDFKNILKEERNYFSLESKAQKALDEKISNLLIQYNDKDIPEDLHAPLLFWVISSVNYDKCKYLLEEKHVYANAQDLSDERKLPILYLIERVNIDNKNAFKLVEMFNLFIKKKVFLLI